MKKRLFLPVAVVLAFCAAAWAQGAGTAGTTESQTTTTKTTKKHTKGAGAGAGEAAGAASGATHQLTGCLAKGPSGGFMLTNGRFKNGVEVKSSQDLSAHVGHQVKLTGTWEKPTAGGEGGAGAKGKQMRTFTATNLEHIADTCPAGGAASAKTGAKKSKGAAAGAETPTK